MSPEQISGDPGIDHRADLYSFGCVAYEILAGRLPFASTTVHGLFADHIAQAPPPLTQLCPECPPALARVVMQCLEKSPDQRPQSAHDILRALDGATTSTTRVRRFVNRMSRRQRLVASVVGVAIIVVAGAVLARSSLHAAHDPREENSLAVLPFFNIGGDSTKDLWAEGLTDHVTTAMSRVSSVRYLATRLAVDRYRGRRNVDPREAGRALQVRHVLHGTLWLQGKQVQVDVVLSNAGDASEEWRDSFLSDAQDILTTLDSATKRIAAAVQRRVAPGSTTPAIDVPSLRGTSDTAAYELYLRAEALVRSRNVRRAVDLFTQAIALDTNFARAYAGLSAALGILSNFADTTNAAVYHSLMVAAHHALAIDPTLGEARTALALAEMQAFRWREADSLFRLGLATDPGDPNLHFQYARYLVYTGHVAEAIPEFQQAKRLDPTSAVISGWLAWMLLTSGHRPDAYAEMDRTLELDSTSVPAVFWAATVAVDRGQRQRARALAEVTWHPGGVTRPAPWPGAAAILYAQLGDTQTVKTIDREATTRPLSRAFGHSSLSNIARSLGDTARAMDELERANEAQEFYPSSPILIALPVDVRRTERFKKLIVAAKLDTAIFIPPKSERPK